MEELSISKGYHEVQGRVAKLVSLAHHKEHGHLRRKNVSRTQNHMCSISVLFLTTVLIQSLTGSFHFQIRRHTEGPCMNRLARMGVWIRKNRLHHQGWKRKDAGNSQTTGRGAEHWKQNQATSWRSREEHSSTWKAPWPGRRNGLGNIRCLCSTLKVIIRGDTCHLIVDHGLSNTWTFCKSF